MNQPDLESRSAGTDRYAEGIKWVVSLATGTVALGLGPAAFDTFSGWEFVAFGLSGALLFLTILAGVLCGLNLIGYASHAEEARRITAEVHAVRGAETQAIDLRQDLERASALADQAKKSGTLLFYVSITCFVAGMLCFVALTGLSAASRRSASTPFRELVQYNVTGLLTPLYMDPVSRRAYRLIATDAGVVVREVPLHVDELDSQ